MPLLNMLATTTTTTTSIDDWKVVFDALTAQVSIPTVIAVLAGGVTASIGLVFMWWGVRKLARMTMGAFRKGKLSI